jgi:protein involved in polysaccharide export with SLBB domain
MFNGSKNILLIVFCTVLVSLTSFSIGAQISTTPSAAQIEQFKKLPKSQQTALAKQFGFDLSLLNSNMSGVKSSEETTTPETQYLNGNNNPLRQVEKTAEEDKELKPFGYEMFEQMQDAFLPQGNIPVPSDYIIGSGDSINISLFGKESQEHLLTVNNEGKITIPGLEPISVAGLSYSEVKQYIANIISTKMIGMKSVVSIGELRSVQVYVLGDVKKPGAYLLSSLSTISNALFISGGPNEVGSLRNIQLKRSGKTLSHFDLYEFMLKGNVTTDQRIQQGDVIFVAPIANQVTVMGEVRRPAIYEVKSNETLAQLLEFAGGLTPQGYAKSVQLSTFDSQQLRKINTIDLTNSNSKTQLIHNGDIVKVHKNIERIGEAVNLAGYVSRPGAQSWQEGMTLNDILNNPADLLIGADFDYGIIVRSVGNFYQTINIKQFSPINVIQGKDVIPLHKNDLVLFFNSLGKEHYYKEQGLMIDDLEKEVKLEERINQLNTPQGVKNQNYRVALEELSAIYGDEEVLKAEESQKTNYLYKILFGNLVEKHQALISTQQMSRNQLLYPIKQLLEQKVTPGAKVKLVEVRGEVRFPGIYPINGKSTVMDAVIAAGGLKESASLYRTEISRKTTDVDETVTTQHMSASLSAALSGVQSENIKLEGRDVINIFKQANWNEELKITLEGEVRYPGEYTVKENETLTQVIERAGGLTEFASLDAAFFTRESLRKLEKQQAQDMARMLNKELALKSMSSSVSNVNVNDVNKLVTALSETPGVGRLIIDLEDIIAGNRDDIKLESGDKLIVPSYRNEVNVIGEVQVATSHMYNPEWTAKKYINSSGGYRAQADDDRVYIIRANGLVDIPDLDKWFGTDKRASIHPGDTVVVPLDASYTDRLTLWEKATSIFYQLTVGLAALSSFR